jgi:hypothetical protein
MLFVLLRVDEIVRRANMTFDFFGALKFWFS